MFQLVYSLKRLPTSLPPASQHTHIHAFTRTHTRAHTHSQPSRAWPGPSRRPSPPARLPGPKPPACPAPTCPPLPASAVRELPPWALARPRPVRSHALGASPVFPQPNGPGLAAAPTREGHLASLVQSPRASPWDGDPPASRSGPSGVLRFHPPSPWARRHVPEVLALSVCRPLCPAPVGIPVVWLVPRARQLPCGCRAGQAEEGGRCRILESQN